MILKKNLFYFSLIFLSLIFIPFVSSVTVHNAYLSNPHYKVYVDSTSLSEINITTDYIILTGVSSTSTFTNSNLTNNGFLIFLNLVKPYNDIKYQDGTITFSDDPLTSINVNILPGQWIIVGNFDNEELSDFSSKMIKVTIMFLAVLILVFALIIFINSMRDNSEFFSLEMVIYYSIVFLIVTFLYIVLINYIIKIAT